ncbi:MAG: glycosyltransferase [Candidatus Omnitrophica bacterium]|nr:glycosyltransferase [Candidatus Omnitrophota bacterium]
MKRIIIFHISEFGGHSKAAQNIKEALLFKFPEAQILNINGFGYFFPWSEKIIDFSYVVVIKHFPKIWGKMYDRKRLVRKLSSFRRWVNARAFTKLSWLINNFRPDCFVATQAFPCGLVADFKEKTGLTTPLVAVVTDYYPHRFWTHQAIDKYIVACPHAKEILISEGIKSEKVEILGIPVSVKFLTSFSKNEIAKEFGFSQSIPSVLIMGGGWGLGPIEKIAQKLDLLEGNFQIIAVCGKNKKLCDWFNQRKRSFKKSVFCFGYIDFIHKIMDFSDIIITKGGGITTSEALSKGLGIITTNSIPGQEERNVAYLRGRGAIVDAPDLENVICTVKELLADVEKLYTLKQKAREASFIDSSLRIAELISRL